MYTSYNDIWSRLCHRLQTRASFDSSRAEIEVSHAIDTGETGEQRL